MADFRIGQVLLRVPGVNVQFAKLANYWFFRRQIASISSQTHPVPEAEIAAMWEALEYRGGRALMPTLVKYLDDRFKVWSGCCLRLDSAHAQGVAFVSSSQT